VILSIDELFNKAKAGNDEAEKELVSILLVRFRLIASHIIGDWDAGNDAAHDAIVSVLQAYRKLEVHTSFTAWAQTIIRRQALLNMKKQKREHDAIREFGRNDGSASYYEISPLIETRIIKCLKELSALDKGYARVLNLKHLGYTFEEICAKLNINSNHAYVLLHRARKALSSCLNKRGN
jgi:RNA polymerase sigma factor (sigma-70 family)